MIACAGLKLAFPAERLMSGAAFQRYFDQAENVVSIEMNIYVFVIIVVIIVVYCFQDFVCLFVSWSCLHRS